MIANGDCSQYTQQQPTLMTCNAVANNVGYIMQGRAVPIQDRWYNVAELAGANPVNLKCEFRRVLLSSYINPTQLEPQATCLRWNIQRVQEEMYTKVEL